jgi:hypothetical protein
MVYTVLIGVGIVDFPIFQPSHLGTLSCTITFKELRKPFRTGRLRIQYRHFLFLKAMRNLPLGPMTEIFHGWTHTPGLSSRRRLFFQDCAPLQERCHIMV